VIADLLFFAALWVSGFVLGWVVHERDWRKAYIAENNQLRERIAATRPTEAKDD
jgi:hypothetical protein